MKYYVLFMLICIPLLAQAQTVSDTASGKTIELNKIELNRKKPEIPMFFPEMKHSMLPAVPGYRLYDLQLMRPVPLNSFDTNKIQFDLSKKSMTELLRNEPVTSLSFNPVQQKSLYALFRDEPLKALWYSAQMLAGMLNNNVVGENKMMQIRMNQAIQSRSGIPESARSANGFITTKKE